MAAPRVTTSAPIVAEGGADFVSLAAETITREVALSTEARGGCALMLAGGGTPRSVYERLSSPEWAGRIAWPGISIYFSDERCVPPDDPESNYAMVRETLLDRLSVKPARVHRMRGEDPDRDGAARAYDALLPERIDVLLLGMGPDGHTASLFPGAAALRDDTRRVTAVQGPKPPHWRLTITPPVIKAARSIIVLARGADKAAMTARALEGGSDDSIPAALARRGRWILDREAASRLRRGPSTETSGSEA